MELWKPQKRSEESINEFAIIAFAQIDEIPETFNILNTDFQNGDLQWMPLRGITLIRKYWTFLCVIKKEIKASTNMQKQMNPIRRSIELSR